MSLVALMRYHSRAGRTERVLTAIQRGAQMPVAIGIMANVNADQLEDALKTLLGEQRIVTQTVQLLGGDPQRAFFYVRPEAADD